jgi:hypothetical protein
MVGPDRVIVACGDQTLDVSRALEPELSVGEKVLVSCGYVVRRLTAVEAAEAAELLDSLDSVAHAS